LEDVALGKYILDHYKKFMPDGATALLSGQKAFSKDKFFIKVP